MKPAKYWRFGNRIGQFITNGPTEGKVDPMLTQVFKSINAAKRQSRELQKGVLGQGSLIVIRKRVAHGS